MTVDRVNNVGGVKKDSEQCVFVFGKKEVVFNMNSLSPNTLQAMLFSLSCVPEVYL